MMTAPTVCNPSVIYCYDCNTVSDTQRTFAGRTAAMLEHDGHRAGVGITVHPDAIAGDMAAMLPDEFRRAYWQRKLDEQFGRPGTAPVPLPEGYAKLVTPDGAERLIRFT